MTAAKKGAIRALGLSAAMAMFALMSVPASASAQACSTATPANCYKLTFESPQSTGTDGTYINGTYTYPGVNGVAVNITDGYASGFGVTGTPISIACDNNGSGNDALCINTTDVASPAATHTASFRNPKATTGVGEFVFAPITTDPLNPRITDFISVVIGNTNAADRAFTLDLYSLDGATLIATYSSVDDKGKSVNLKKGTAVTVNLSDFNFSLGKDESSLALGYRFEWGATAAGAGGDQLYIDNLIFKSEVAPEPSSILLLGTGLIGLVPLARRRRKKA